MIGRVIPIFHGLSGDEPSLKKKYIEDWLINLHILWIGEKRCFEGKKGEAEMMAYFWSKQFLMYEKLSIIFGGKLYIFGSVL